MNAQTLPAADDCEDKHLDGCLCGVDHGKHEITSDHELPAATGGVQGDKKPRPPRRRATKMAMLGEL